jgi:MFS family permease
MNTPVPAHTLYSPSRRWTMLALLFLVATCSYLDRHIVSVLLEPIKKEFGVSDTMLGLLTGFAFAIFYATLGIPVARWADKGNRRTIITAAVAIWSAFTVLCGFAGSFWQLAVARVGVGAGEAGAFPPAQSLIADYFPPERRASALSIFTSAATAGYLIAFVGGSALAAAYGWRTALIVVGLPGLLLALLAWWLLDEPRLRLGRSRSDEQRSSLMATLGELFAKLSYRYVVIGAMFYALMAYGSAVFFPSFMVRSLHVSLTQVGAVFGIVSAGAALVGTLGGGVLADRLGSRDARWYAWLPAAGCLLAWPIYAAAIMMNSFNSFVALAGLGGLLVGGCIPSMFTALHAVCGTARRALAVAVLMFVMSLIGSGLGPIITGVLSDAWVPSKGTESLRWAMLAATLFLLPAAWCFWASGRHLRQDMEA